MKDVEAQGHAMEYCLVVDLYALTPHLFLLNQRDEKLSLATAQIEDRGAFLDHVHDDSLVRPGVGLTHAMPYSPPFVRNA